VSPGYVYDPEHWENRAGEMRLLAATVTDPEKKARILQIARDYDELALRAARRANNSFRMELK
jgi:hypothetical protein